MVCTEVQSQPAVSIQPVITNEQLIAIILSYPHSGRALRHSKYISAYVYYLADQISRKLLENIPPPAHYLANFGIIVIRIERRGRDTDGQLLSFR